MLAQDLVGPAKLLYLALEKLEPIPVIGSLRRWSREPRSFGARLLSAPATQSLRRTADLRCDRGHRRPFRTVVGPVLANHPHRTLADLRRKLVPCRHRSSFSQIGASGKPGTLQRPRGASAGHCDIGNVWKLARFDGRL